MRLYILGCIHEFCIKRPRIKVNITVFFITEKSVASIYAMHINVISGLDYGTLKSRQSQTLSQISKQPQIISSSEVKAAMQRLV